MPSIGGLPEVDYLFKRLLKPPNWNQDLQTVCQYRLQAYDAGVRQIESYLDEVKKTKDPARIDKAGIWSAQEGLGELYTFQGNMLKAVEYFKQAYETVTTLGVKEDQQDLEEKIGVAYLREAEIENSKENPKAEGFIFPLRPEMGYQGGDNAENAIKHFLKFLERDPSDLEVKWLLNLAYMTLGKYPAGVPKEHLIPPSIFESKEDIGRFVDIAPDLGLNRTQQAGGIIVDDFDNDGYLDIITTDWDPCAPMHFYHNNGDGTFTDRAVEAGLSKELGALNLVQADYNNDGCMDILIVRGAWEVPERKSLMRNNCDGTFTDVTYESGMAFPAARSNSAAWADYDNDGHVDVFVANEFGPAQLFHNKGDGTFVDVGAAAGIDQNRFSKGVTAGDYDNDGYMDFYISNLDGGGNLLYHNNRNGTFTNVAKELHVEQPLRSFPVWFFDYNNDGWLDLFGASASVQSDEEVIRSYMNLPVKGDAVKLYRNTGKGTFEDVSKEVGLDHVFMAMGSNFGDVDNDGWLDVFLGTGAPSYAALTPKVLFRNHDGKYFADITTSAGIGSLHKGHGVAFADLNNDGQEEILAMVGGATPGDSHQLLIFQNPGHNNNWITLHLVGVKTNRAAIGARIKVTVETEDHHKRDIYRAVGSNSSFGNSPLQQHIGLGKAKEIESLEVWWPTSNSRQVFHNIGVNQFIEIKEFEKDYTKLNRKSFALGGKTNAPPAAANGH